MVSIAALTEHYKQAFTEQQAKILVEGAVAIEHDLVNREDFSKLTATVERLADRMDGLAAAQERTDEQFTGVRKEMREGFDRLDTKTDRLEEKHDSLEEEMDGSFADVRKQLGGLSLSVGMGLEAYTLDKIPRINRQAG